jgi:uncharacterized protein (TIGR00369 family)
VSRLEPTSVRCEPDPENPGWNVWESHDAARFNGSAMGKMLVRKDGDTVCRLRMFPGYSHANLPGSVHGGVTMSLIDVALFATHKLLSGGNAAGAVTLEVHCQFIGAGELEEPLDAVTEVLKETRRLSFMRGKVMQGENLVAAYTGTIRKPTSAPQA